MRIFRFRDDIIFLLILPLNAEKELEDIQQKVLYGSEWGGVYVCICENSLMEKGFY